jgi:hypothetical protein
MRRFFRSRSPRRRSWCWNVGFLYGALSGIAFVTIKLFKYSGGGTRRDVPWAILIVLLTGLAGSILWQLGRVLLGPPPKRHGDSSGNCQVLRSDPKEKA